jgi:hypothetical protein
MEPNTKESISKVDGMVRDSSIYILAIAFNPSSSHLLFWLLLGHGVYHYPDGRCYSGEYKDDRPNGKGIQTASDGTILYDGQWTMGEFIGA